MIYLFVLFFLYLFYNFYWKRRQLPPGPTPWPLAGNMLSLIGNERIEYQFLKWKEQYGDIYTIWIGTEPVITLNSYQTFEKYLIKEGSKFVSRPDPGVMAREMRGGNYGIFETWGDLWKVHRRFSHRGLKGLGVGKKIMERRISKELEFLLLNINNAIDSKDEIHMKSHIDLIVGSIINTVICGQQFNNENKKTFKEMKASATGAINGLSNPLTSFVLFNQYSINLPFVNKSAKSQISSTKKVIDYMKNQIKDHLDNNDYSQEIEPRDFIDAYLTEKHNLNEEDTQLFTMEQIANVCADIWIAGQEAPSSTIIWAIGYLITHQEYQKKLQKELDEVIGSKRMIQMKDKVNLPYTIAVITETQRCANVIGLNLPRQLVEDTVIESYSIPRGTDIIPQLSAVMYDPKVFKYPETFNPERFIKEGKYKSMEEVIPFSVGKRSCLGEALARMELFMIISNLFNQYEFAPGELSPSLKKPSSNSFYTENFKCKMKRRK